LSLFLSLFCLPLSCSSLSPLTFPFSPYSFSTLFVTAPPSLITAGVCVCVSVCVCACVRVCVCTVLLFFLSSFLSFFLSPLHVFLSICVFGFFLCLCVSVCL